MYLTGLLNFVSFEMCVACAHRVSKNFAAEQIVVGKTVGAVAVKQGVVGNYEWR